MTATARNGFTPEKKIHLASLHQQLSSLTTTPRDDKNLAAKVSTGQLKLTAYNSHYYFSTLLLPAAEATD
jgi:hypothetical protein